jgi:hypothetical protein
MPIPPVNAGESQNEYVGRCVSDINEEYPNEQAVAVCISTYQRKNVKANAADRVGMKMEGIRIEQDFAKCGEVKAELKAKGVVDLAADYPMDTCIKDQTARYGDVETAQRVCKCIVDTY